MQYASAAIVAICSQSTTSQADSMIGGTRPGLSVTVLVKKKGESYGSGMLNLMKLTLSRGRQQSIYTNQRGLYLLITQIILICHSNCQECQMKWSVTIIVVHPDPDPDISEHQQF